MRRSGALTADEFNAAVTRGHERVRRPDPTRDLPPRPRRSAAASRRPRSPSTSISTRTSPATTSRSSRAAATSPSTIWPVADGDHGTPARASVEAVPRRARSTHTLALPLRHDDVLASLLAGALDALGPEQAETLADEVGYEYGRSSPSGWIRARATARSAPRSPPSPTRSPRTASPRTPSRAATASRSCPSAARSATPRTQYPHVVCALDRGMIRGMLAGLYGETSPRFEASRPDGADHCVARV